MLLQDSAVIGRGEGRGGLLHDTPAPAQEVSRMVAGPFRGLGYGHLLYGNRERGNSARMLSLARPVYIHSRACVERKMLVTLNVRVKFMVQKCWQALAECMPADGSFRVLWTGG